MRLIQSGVLVLLMFAVALTATSAPAVVVFEEDFESYTQDSDFIYWMWPGFQEWQDPTYYWPSWYAWTNPTVTQQEYLGMWKRIEVTTDPTNNQSYPKEMKAWWTIENNPPAVDSKPVFNPPGVNGQTTSGNNFMFANSDWAAQQDYADTGASYDMWTPVFSTVGVSNPWLHCDTILEDNNNYGFSVFMVDATTDNGATWNTVWTRASTGRAGDDLAGVDPPATTYLPTHDNCGGYYGRLDVDLSSVANESNVMLRFRQYEPSDDWFWIVDNVVVDDQAPVGPAEEVIFSESFDNGLGNMSASGLKTGIHTWNTDAPTTIYDENDPLTGDDVRCNRINCIEHNGNGPDFAVVVKEANTAADEWMMTALIDLSEAVEVVLSYEDEIRPGNVGDTFEVYAMQDTNGNGIADSGDTILETLFTYDGVLKRSSQESSGAENAYFALRNLDASVLAGLDNAFLAFVHQCDSTDSPGNHPYFWALDNISVTAKLVPEPSTLALLLGGMLMGFIAWRRRR